MFGPLFADRYFIENQTPQNATRNHNKSAKARFVIHFGSHLGTQLLSFFIFVAKVANHETHINIIVFQGVCFSEPSLF